MRCAVCAILLAFVAVPATAAQGNASVKVPVPAVDPTAPRATAPIGPLDRLEVMVFREPELSVADAPVDESADHAAACRRILGRGEISADALE